VQLAKLEFETVFTKGRFQHSAHCQAKKFVIICGIAYLIFRNETAKINKNSKGLSGFKRTCFSQENLEKENIYT